MDFDNDDILKQAKERYKEARQHSSAWRQEARRCFDFRAGNQWKEEDKLALMEQMRMPTTFNRVDPYVRAIAGLEAGNRQEVRYIPREMGDVGVNELYTETVRWIRDLADAEFEEADAFLDAVISGIGATETYLDYDEDPEGKVCIDHLDCLTEVVWDPAAKKRNLTDRKFDFRVKYDIDESEIEGMFPDKAAEIGKMGSSGDWNDTEDDQEPWNRNPETSYEKDRDPDQPKKKKFTLVDYQWREKEQYYKVADPISGQLVDMEVEKFEKLRDNLKKYGVQLQAAKLRRNVWYRAFIVGNAVMKVGPAPCKESSTRKYITGYRDRNRKMWYGMVRAMIDPQEWANKFFSQILHIINSNSKGGLLAETDAFVNPRKAEEQWADPSSVVSLKPGGLQKVKERQPATYPASIDRMMQFAVQSLGDVTGLPLELIGMVDRDQAGVLEAERKRTGITMLAALFDSFRQYHKDQGTLLLYFVKEYLSDGRLVRINGEAGQKYVPLVRMPGTIKFDVIVDEMPDSPNNKERVWASLQVMLPQLMQAGMPPQMLEEFIRYSPLPESFAEKMRQLMAHGNQVNQQAQEAISKLQQELAKEQQQLQQLQLALKDKSQEGQLREIELQIQAKEAAIKEREAEIKQMEAETKRLAAEADAEAKLIQAGTPQEQGGADLELLKLQTEMRKAELEAQTKIVVAEMQAKTSLKQAAMSANATNEDDPMEFTGDGEQVPRPSLANLVETVNQALQNVMQQGQTNVQSIASMLQQYQQQQEEAARRPRNIEWGPDGAIVSVDGRPVIRDPATGRAIGVQ